MMTIIDAPTYLRNLSNADLLKLKSEMGKSQIDENSIARKVVKDIYGEENNLVLQLNQLFWPLLEVIGERNH